MLKKRKISLFSIINGSVMIIICICMIYPFVNTMAKSFSDEFAIISGEVFWFPVGFNTDAYQKVIQSSTFWITLKNTVYITIVGTVLSLILTLATGFVFSRDLVGKRTFFVIILFTMFFSGGMIPMYLMIDDLNLINTHWALILPGAFSAYNMILARNYFQSLPESVMESATIDGCNDIEMFIKIALPMATPIIATLALFVAVGNWNIFMPGILYLEDPDLYPLQVYVRNVVFEFELSLDQSMAEQNAGDTRIGSEAIKGAVLMVSVIPIMCVYPFIQKYFVKGINMGAVKG